MSVDATSSSNATTAMSTVGSTSSGSLQLLYAQLQLEQADLAQDDAMAYLDKIEASQAEQSLCAEMISQATALMEQADTSGEAVQMPYEMVCFFQDRGITFDSAGDDTASGNIYDQNGDWIDTQHSADEWEYNIENLSTYRDELGTETQTDMVYVEDFMGQYNSYLTGANSTIDSGNQTLQTILT